MRKNKKERKNDAITIYHHLRKNYLRLVNNEGVILNSKSPRNILIFNSAIRKIILILKLFSNDIRKHKLKSVIKELTVIENSFKKKIFFGLLINNFNVCKNIQSGNQTYFKNIVSIIKNSLEFQLLIKIKNKEFRHLKRRLVKIIWYIKNKKNSTINRKTIKNNLKKKIFKIIELKNDYNKIFFNDKKIIDFKNKVFSFFYYLELYNILSDSRIDTKMYRFFWQLKSSVSTIYKIIYIIDEISAIANETSDKSVLMVISNFKSYYINEKNKMINQLLFIINNSISKENFYQLLKILN